jgi:hypothetical protein
LKCAGWVACADDAGGVGDFEGGVGQELGVPAGLVEAFVMASTDEHEVPRESRVHAPTEVLKAVLAHKRRPS